MTTIHRLTERHVPRVHPDRPPERTGIKLLHVDEYGIRTYARTGVIAKLEETWVVRPDGTLMLYTHHDAGQLNAVYRNKARRAKA